MILSHTSVMRAVAAGNGGAGSTEAASLLTLERDRLFVLRDAKGTSVFCLSGVLWITEDERVTDLVLRPGERFLVAHPGLVLVIGLEASTFRVVSEDRAGFVRRLASGLSRRLRRRGAGGRG